MALDNTTEWSAGPGTSDGLIVFLKEDSKGAFFGGVPIQRPVIPALPTAAQIAAVLVALGLATQAA